MLHKEEVMGSYLTLEAQWCSYGHYLGGFIAIEKIILLPTLVSHAKYVAWLNFRGNLLTLDIFFNLF